ncbi:hypothetical protein C497_06474 [Halalkalicoccus jeotgali B3]|uniref:Uncharacterized protein n=1 Tax=Halalkalicoccus jeotgali (strain DSM 18796 / CECT 7217 / JCM 14584 / KCTC 4019 / B3) TaxID=795797 RepID=D8JCC4_HALJB|nr:hypothetical protein HacjB3_18443 [Halalkalicoccus jeotgali B3]ELY38806.1 hypothetical protein C497_06474 [Halalkalicoccus jeotgali B3]
MVSIVSLLVRLMQRYAIYLLLILRTLDSIFELTKLGIYSAAEMGPNLMPHQFLSDHI